MLTVTTPPAAYPVDLNLLADHLRVTAGDETTLLTAYLAAATDYCQGYQGRAYITQTLTLHVAAAESITLPRAPLQAITSVTCTLEDGSTVTVNASEYRLDTTRAYAVLTFEDLDSEAEYVTIVFTAGYGDSADDVPESIKQAILLLVGQWYANREVTQGATVEQIELPYAVSALLNQQRLNWGIG